MSALRFCVPIQIVGENPAIQPNFLLQSPLSSCLREERMFGPKTPRVCEGYATTIGIKSWLNSSGQHRESFATTNQHRLCGHLYNKWFSYRNLPHLLHASLQIISIFVLYEMLILLTVNVFDHDRK